MGAVLAAQCQLMNICFTNKEDAYTRPRPQNTRRGTQFLRASDRASNVAFSRIDGGVNDAFELLASFTPNSR
jgi:hypothetical protein